MPKTNEDVVAELRRANRKLQELDAAKEEFVSMASHQLRTPLTSVKGYISMLLDGDAGELNDLQKQFLTEAFDSSERMAHIINDFLNVSRLHTGKFELERHPDNLAEVVGYEVDHLKSTAKLHGLELRYDQPESFPTFEFDKSKIQQVIMNFIDNAIFYAPDTKEVLIELHANAGQAVFKVKDHGMGVPHDAQAHLFTKFYRASNARQQRPDGTGVGLFLARKVVLAHGGTIIFESHEKKGSTFGFTLPLAQHAE